MHRNLKDNVLSFTFTPEDVQYLLNVIDAYDDTLYSYKANPTCDDDIRQYDDYQYHITPLRQQLTLQLTTHQELTT